MDEFLNSVSSDQRGRDHIRKPSMDYYRQVYLDLVSPMLPALRYAVALCRRSVCSLAVTTRG